MYILKISTCFFLPGLYSVVNIPDIETGEAIPTWTYTLITMPANDLRKQVHNAGDNKWRMPLFLPSDLSQKWLAEDISLPEYQAMLDYEMPSGALEAWPVYSIRTTRQ